MDKKMIIENTLILNFILIIKYLSLNNKIEF